MRDGLLCLIKVFIIFNFESSTDHFQPTLKLCWRLAICTSDCNGSPFIPNHCPAVDLLQPKISKIEMILPVVAALRHRAAELQAHRSFCHRQAIVRTAEVAQGMNWLSHSLACFLSSCLMCSQSPFFTLIFLSILPSLISHICFLSYTSLSFLSNTHPFFSSHTHAFWPIHYRIRMFYSFCLWFLLLTNYRPVASHQLEAHCSPNPFLPHCSHCNMSVIK